MFRPPPPRHGIPRWARPPQPDWPHPFGPGHEPPPPPPPPPPPHEGPGRRPREEARLFEHGDLRLMIMVLLKDQPRYGYEIIKELEARTGGAYSPSPGVVYPTLAMLQDLGFALVEEFANGRRRYRLTAEGEAFLAAQQRVVDAILARIAERARSRRPPPPAVAEAFDRLDAALKARIAATDGGEAETSRLVAILAGATDAIARG